MQRFSDTIDELMRPLRLKACYKDYPWGGSRLREKYGKTDAPEICAESWELACSGYGSSRIELDRGRSIDLAELAGLDRRLFWGTESKEDTFPIIVKLLDAESSPSVQVHPSDSNADAKNGERGKTEVWYIVDCKPQSYIYMGFSREIDREEFLARARAGTICEVLNRIPVQKKDVFRIYSGTIHAIGAGVIIAEIQQNSNTTFRIFDYNRVNAAGEGRELHLDRAAEVLNYRPSLPEDYKANAVIDFPEFTLTEMCSCGYFTSLILDIHTRAELICSGSSFRHLLCVDGNGTISTAASTQVFDRGDSFFLPAAMGKFTVTGRCRLILTQLGKNK